MYIYLYTYQHLLDTLVLQSTPGRTLIRVLITVLVVETGLDEIRLLIKLIEVVLLTEFSIPLISTHLIQLRLDATISKDLIIQFQLLLRGRILIRMVIPRRIVDLLITQQLLLIPLQHNPINLFLIIHHHHTSFYYFYCRSSITFYLVKMFNNLNSFYYLYSLTMFS